MATNSDSLIISPVKDRPLSSQAEENWGYKKIAIAFESNNVFTYCFKR